MKSGDARVALIGFPSVGKVSDGQHGPWGGSRLSSKHDCQVETGTCGQVPQRRCSGPHFVPCLKKP